MCRSPDLLARYTVYVVPGYSRRGHQFYRESEFRDGDQPNRKKSCVSKSLTGKELSDLNGL